MGQGYGAAVIFDVDGPLLDLTPDEEQAFFAPFEILHGLTGLSNDWDSYRIRNDEEIIAEILHRHFGRPATPDEMDAVRQTYAAHLEQGYATGRLKVSPIPGALELLQRLAARKDIALGTATANLLHAARVRLQAAHMWPHVCGHPGAADGGGAKRDVLARVIAGLDLPKDRIVFLGDNLNDLDAGIANNVHFIGFHVAPDRRERLLKAGAQHVAGEHLETWRLVCELLALDPTESISQ